MRTRISIAILFVAAMACKGQSDQNESKRMPKPPPPASAEAPAQLRIDVQIDGKPAPAIDAAKLAATKPDFAEGEHRAWKIESLVGPGSAFAVTGEKAATLTLHPASDDKAPLPVLIVTRRGEVIAAMIERDDPFPAYHGHGGRLGRRGDPLPRIAGVTKIDITSPQ
jgi:hypothetical protein